MVCKTETGLVYWNKHFWFYAEEILGKYVVMEANCADVINASGRNPAEVIDTALTQFAL